MSTFNLSDNSLPPGLKVGDTLTAERPQRVILQVTAVLEQWDVTDPQWGGPVTVNGKDDWTLAFRKCIAAAGASAKTSGQVQTVNIPAGVYGLCPQASDNRPLWRRCIALPSDVTIKGAGTDKTTLLFFCEGMKDPLTTWINTADNYVKISRGRMFDVDSRLTEGGAKRNITITGLRIDGQAGFTNNALVGGDRNTGDGWDMTHKGVAIDGPQEIDNITVDNCELCNWRGEIIWSGGIVKRITVTNCKVWGSNGSAVSCSADFRMENCEIGGIGWEKSVYNGTENQAIRDYQKSIYRNVKVQCRSTNKDGTPAPASGNALVHIGCVGSTLLAEDCEFIYSGKGILFSNQAHDVMVRRCKFTDCLNGSITSSFMSVPEGNANRFQDITFENCTINLGTLFVSQHSSPTNLANWKSMAFNGNDVGSRAMLFSGTFLGSFTSWVCRDNKFGLRAVGTFSGNNAPLWTGSVYSTTAPLVQTGTPKVDVFNGALTVAVHPVADRIILNAKGSSPTIAAILDTTANKYPVGFTTRVFALATGWILQANASTAWTEDLAIPSGGSVLIRVNEANKFEVA
jgi:hypothetical protein